MIFYNQIGTNGCVASILPVAFPEFTDLLKTDKRIMSLPTVRTHIQAARR